ncbi:MULTISPECIES: efflux RND transporter periplasmic adaptor subunit [Cupriavidus]|jgi:membrane fusion protein, multidrug efflux system|uniref:Efflux RND transporter periplasmic adaptor subunit n=1 Tax=Cupriavidus metallidurans TaxID=119219 RepID=A0A2L0XBR4_9BURK|nr:MULTISPECIES: efflux RND transporter periplasmic adaptor subunit [Cupriavidus]AVA37525.1 efflux RND transporter periplasmic adaptor subunit [Cupriavidus metallidurans]KWR74727.1 efflux transporter periplasmic adaptor subunit [Cupriavidus sp. SHE]QBP11535.1 efflux RND transporter periplasmic adaptor subunit [Cupriavidus metallidurans]QWC88590.1 efflux RND transporter periplasmic adaptor subunit [Cupriavidus metallidurans]
MKTDGIDQPKGFVDGNWSAAAGTGRGRTSRWPAVVAVLVIVVAGWFGWKHWFAPKPATKGPAVTTVATAIVQQGDVPLEVNANGNVVAMQTVEVRPQVSSTVRAVHIKEGQSVKPGDLLFSLDTRMDEANLDKARAQLMRDQADLSDARRTLTRSQELLQRNFISRSAVDTAQAKVDGFEATIRADQAAIEASRVAISYGTIRATIGGRTGVINVFPGSLVTPTTATPMVIVAQIAPITVMFTLPERQLAALREALRSGPVSVTALPNDGSKQPVTGKITFVDNTVDPQYGSIRVKAMFGNEEHRLWPGTYANVNATVQVLKDALSVPPQAIVAGPEGRFVYTVQADNKVARVPVQVIATTAAAAVIEGVQPGARVVTEGAQNLRPGSLVREAAARGASAPAAATKH